MVNSQNGWPALTVAPAHKLRWITGRVLPGDVATIFDWLGQQFDALVEPIRPADSWGWAYRDIRGATTLSNHASGTAIDLNATTHPLGASGTFTPAQAKQIRAILRDLDGVVRWGGDYPRKDEMHFEINAGAAAAARVAAKIRAAATQAAPEPTAPAATTPTTSTDLGALMPVLDLTDAHKKPVNNATAKRLQALLVAAGHTALAIDGSAGTATRAALFAFQKAKGLPVDYIAGPATWRALLGIA